jgi:hypothetical protein
MLTADDNFGVKYFLRRIIFRHRYGARDRPKPWLWSQLEGDIHQAGASLHSAEAWKCVWKILWDDDEHEMGEQSLGLSALDHRCRSAWVS